MYLSQPARLYIKQCPQTGLKYFGKTVKEDIENYNGSGKRWTQHIKKHGKPDTVWVSDWFFDDSISRFALLFSKLNKIVESDEWANLIEEDGLNVLGAAGGQIAKERQAGWLNPKWREENQSKNSKKAARNNYKNKVGLWGPNNKRNKGQFAINNGTETRFVFREEDIPIGWVVGSHQSGENNSQSKTMWVTNGEETKKISVTDVIEEGWRRGRVFKQPYTTSSKPS